MRAWTVGRSPRENEIIGIAAVRHRVSPLSILNGSHERPQVLARRDAAIALRQLGYSTPRIGRILGIHHSSVLYHLRQAPAGIPTSFDFNPDIPDLSGEWAI